MASLIDDSAVEPTGPGTFRASLHEDWSVWGPNGGYLTAVALRAAGAYEPGARPVSVHTQFTATPAFAPVDLEVAMTRGTRRAKALRVEMRQGGKQILTAQVWAAAPGLAGPERLWTAAPDFPPPADLPELTELIARDGFGVLPIWERCYEIRMRDWKDQGLATRVLGWMRLRQPYPEDADPWLNAGRVAFASDVAQFPAITQAFDPSEMTFIAPSMDLYVAFHGSDSAPWLLVEGEATGAGGGVLGGRARIWSADGRLLGAASQQMLYRELGQTWG